jgi:hypothetical protein
MTGDPFDSLRSRNPVPPESLPDAPMTVASSIVAGRPSLGRGLTIAAAAGALVLAGGGSWLLWSRGGEREMAVQVTSTPAAAVPTSPVEQAEEEMPTVVVYFLDARTSTLVPVARDLNVLNVRPLPDLAPLTLDLLFFGPGAWDAAPLPDPVAAAETTLDTAIPAGTELRGITVDAAGTAYVDLSGDFAAAPPEALAQVVFTATRLAGVASVRFLIEGEPQYLMAERLSLVPAASLPTGADPVDPVTRGAFAALLPVVMIESPALGDTLTLPEVITGITGETDADVLLDLLAADGTVLWHAAAPATCPGCPAGTFAVEVPDSLAAGTGWTTLQAYLSTFDRGPLAQYPVWLIPCVAPGGEPEIPEPTTTTPATTTTSTTTTSTTIAANPAPWSGAPLALDAVPAVARDTWAAAENRDECALLFPTDPASLGEGAVVHDRYFGGGWGLAWDLPRGPGRWEPGGEYCADCGREAFGVAGTGGDFVRGTEDAIWPNRLAWTADAQGGSIYSHAGYGYEGVTSGTAGEPLLTYLFIAHQGCMYNVWSYLGEEHLLSLIGQLRFVEGMGTP